jgi:hypothetical protein
MFYQKAIAAWRDGTPNSRIQLVKKYIESVPGFSTPQLVVNQSGVTNNLLQLIGLGSSDPFYAVIASKE